ncbi:MAG: CBS domain-containing protein [Balneolaceae bacterium]
MKVRDILSKKGSEVYHVTPETTVFDAISKMAELNIGALLVMEKGNLKGIISERDYRNKVILKGRTSKKTRVEEIMTEEVFCVTPDDKVDTCMAIMTEKKFRHLPVIENDSVAGVVSIGDLVKTIIDKQHVENKNLRSYITGKYPG